MPDIIADMRLRLETSARLDAGGARQAEVRERVQHICRCQPTAIQDVLEFGRRLPGLRLSPG